MEIGIEVYWKQGETREAIIKRAIAKADRMGVEVVICATSKTAPVIIKPGDTPERADTRMKAVERASVLTVIAVYGAFILFAVVLVLWALSGAT